MLYEYTTIQNEYKKNGDRHLKNAIRYRDLDMLSHSVGSLKKAIKNYEVYNRLKESENSIPTEFKLYINSLAEQVANNIMNGS